MSKDLYKPIIENKLATWSKEKEVSDYLKEKLAEEGQHGDSHLDNIIEEAITKAKLEDKPEWTKFLFDNMQKANEAQKGNKTQINIFSTLAKETNDIDDLVEVKEESNNNDFEKLI